jgi:hypothetical protein
MHPRQYKNVNFNEHVTFQEMKVEGRLHVVPFNGPVSVQTPSMTLATEPCNEDGERLPFINVVAPKTFLDFMARFEEHLVTTSIENKKDWFKKKLDDDAVRECFKSFMRPGGVLKLKLTDATQSFDASGKPTRLEDIAPESRVRCIVEANRLSFGKQEFGTVLRVVQMQVLSDPPCMLLDDTASMISYGSDDEDEFL